MLLNALQQCNALGYRPLPTTNKLPCLVDLRHKAHWTGKRLSLCTKLRLYQTLVLLILLCASETWTLLAFDTKSLESFHMKCQKHILGMRWYDSTQYTKIAEHTGLLPLMDLIIRRHNSLFGHVAKHGKNTPAYQALQRQIEISLGHLFDLWRCAIHRGHSGVMQRSQLSTQ